jgi:hypothetical protein
MNLSQEVRAMAKDGMKERSEAFKKGGGVIYTPPVDPAE